MLYLWPELLRENYRNGRMPLCRCQILKKNADTYDKLYKRI